jgi:hypothetical protein
VGVCSWARYPCTVKAYWLLATEGIGGLIGLALMAVINISQSTPPRH